MRFQEALLGLFAAGALAMPAALFGESSSPSLSGRDTVSDIPPMDIDWSVFDSGEFEELVPVPETNASLTKRADKLDLKDATTLTWKSENARAKLTATYKGANEHVIELDDFSDVVKKLDCTPPKMQLDFDGKNSYRSAKGKWDWVNKQSANHIVLITNDERCGRKNQRNAYNVTNIEFVDDKNSIKLVCSQIDFKKAVHDGHFRVEVKAVVANSQPNNFTNTGSGTFNGTAPPVKRSEDSLSLEERARIGTGGSIYKRWYGNIFTLSNANNAVSLDCYECGTNGYLTVVFDASISWFSLDHAYFEFKATNVAALMHLKLQGKTSGVLSGSKKLFSWTIAGINIPGIAHLGFGPEFGVGWSASAVGGATVYFGADLVLDTPSAYRVCFKGCSSSASGWGLNLYRWGPWVSGSVHAAANVFSYTALSAGASFLSWGWQVGVAARAPELAATFDTISGSNVCGNPAYHNGLQAKINAGGSVYLYTGSNPVTPAKKWIWLQKWFNILTQCYGWA